MEFNYRAMDERAHSSDRPPLTRYNYFSEQPLRGGYSTGGVRRDGEYLQSSVREAIQREIDKERIREEFVEENSGRRAVEDELRRDLRMEKELALRGNRVNEVGRFQAGMGMTVSEERSLEERIARIVEDRIVSSLEGRIVNALERSGMMERLGRIVEERVGRTVEERIAISLERRIARAVDERIAISLERFETEAKKRIGEQPLVPFLPERVERMIKEVEQPMGYIMKEAKSEANLCNTNTSPKQQGAVRKAAVSTELVAKNTVKEDWSCANRSDTNAPPKQGVVRMAPSTDVSNNRVKEVWSCSLCKVNTTSKRTLDDHVRGKKHKMNEASLNLGSKRKNSDNVLPSNKKPHC